MSMTIIRSACLHFPSSMADPEHNAEYFADGLLVLENAVIVALGDASELSETYNLQTYPGAKFVEYKNKLIIPGLIDSHLHFPQTEMIASYGDQLLEWLENYTFPTEQKFANPEYAKAMADVFLRQLHKNGTTTGMVYATVHKASVDALFEASKACNMLMIAGKVCMDRNSPVALQDTPESAQKDSAEMIEKWHGKGRQHYALTPRFAPTSSPEQLAALGELASQYSDVFIQTHLSENQNEIAWVKSLYPQFEQYLDVYDHYGMVRPRAVFGHCLHLEQREWQRLAQTDATIAFCPTSNLFLGSGLFDLASAQQHQVNVALASDVGAGTSFNMLKTMGEAYKVCQLNHTKLHPLHGLYMMTQGAATSLQLEQHIGNLNVGTDADFVVLDTEFDELTTLRLQESQSCPEDIIFALSMLGDDRAISATWIGGQPVFQKEH